MKMLKPIKENSFAIYGLGLSGKSSFKFLKKKIQKKFIHGMTKKIRIIKKNLIYLKKN